MIAKSKFGTIISQRKYVLDLLTEIGKLGCRPVDTLMDPNVKLTNDEGDLPYASRYRRLVGKLNYLSATEPNISVATSVVSQFLQAPRSTHWNAVIRILRYLKGAPGKELYKNNDRSIICGDADWVG